MHKCSGYCKRKRKCGNVFIIRCKFGFPRIPCESAKLNPVTNSLKSRSKIYQLARAESETIESMTITHSCYCYGRPTLTFSL